MKVSKAKLIASIRGEGEYQKSFARGMGHLFAQSEHICVKVLFLLGFRGDAYAWSGRGRGLRTFASASFWANAARGHVGSLI